MEPIGAQIHEVAEEVWSSLLDLALVPAGASSWHPAEGCWVEVNVEIRGAWSGAVRLQCSRSFARFVAGKMFQLAREARRRPSQEVPHVAPGGRCCSVVRLSHVFAPAA